MLEINTGMTNHLISNWIQTSFTDNLNEVAALTIRADGTIRNAGAITQSAWSKNATGSIQLLISALDRTVSQMSRGKNNDMKFVAFLGGDYARGIAGHFHALLQYPANANPQEFINDFDHVWKKRRQKLSSHSSERAFTLNLSRTKKRLPRTV